MLSRRRFICISASASAAALGLCPAAMAAPAAARPVIWRGVVMGSMASMTLVHPDPQVAIALRDRALAEVERLERIFSLYRRDSALVHLNEQGTLEQPPLELVELLGFALRLAEESGGAFDPSVQPLFQLYWRHFTSNPTDPVGPSQAEIDATRARVDYRAIQQDSGRIGFARAGMRLTLNGVAQGYLTDRIAALLKAGGMENLLIDLGEIKAAGRHPEGRPWEAGISDPNGRVLRKFTLDAELPALATSSSQGTVFEPSGRHHHLFDPASGRSAPGRQTVSVAAPTATLADGLSTTLAILEPSQRAGLMARYPAARAFFTDPDGGRDEPVRG